MLHGKRGFSLAEVMIVILIVAILAVVSGNIMSGIEKKAAVAEATAAMISLRHSMRAFFAKHGHYPDDLGGNLYSLFYDPTSSTDPDVLEFRSSLNPADFRGIYFNSVNYDFSDVTLTAYCINCRPDPSEAGFGAGVPPIPIKRAIGGSLADPSTSGSYITLWPNGNFTQWYVSCSGFTEHQ